MSFENEFNKILANLLSHPLEVSGDLYWYSLGVVPPVKPEPSARYFGMGEIYSHDSEGRPLYFWFTEFGAKYYGFFGDDASAGRAFFNQRVFCGHFPAGLVWADRNDESEGDYAHLAFQSYKTLKLSVVGGCPEWIAELIKTDAAALQARQGDTISISGNHSVVLRK